MNKSSDWHHRWGVLPSNCNMLGIIQVIQHIVTARELFQVWPHRHGTGGTWRASQFPSASVQWNMASLIENWSENCVLKQLARRELLTVSLQWPTYRLFKWRIGKPQAPHALMYSSRTLCPEDAESCCKASQLRTTWIVHDVQWTISGRTRTKSCPSIQNSINILCTSVCITV